MLTSVQVILIYFVDYNSQELGNIPNFYFNENDINRMTLATKHINNEFLLLQEKDFLY